MNIGWRISIITILLIRCFYFAWIIPPHTIIFPNNSVTINGYIDDYPEERINTNRYQVRIVELNNYPVEETARLLIVTNPYINNLKYGDSVELYGTIENPKDFITDTGKTFDYDSYLKLNKVYGIIKDPEIHVTGHDKGNLLTNTLFYIRNSFSKTLDNLLNKQDSILTRGVLLGEKSGITNIQRNNLAKTSTSHIIALSGYNITIVSEIIIQLTKSLSILARTTLGGIGILLFVILAGGGSSALRAMIMAFILLYSRSRGKTYNALWALLFSFIILISINPLALRYDMGLHLSILATFGLIIFQTPIAVFFIKKHIPRLIADTLASTISATIMTLPYIAYNMGIISIVGIFANLIVVPLLPALMLFGFITGLIGQISTFIAIPFSYITHIISSIILGTINLLGSLPFSVIYKEHISMLFIILIYGIILYFAIKINKKSTTLH